MRLIYILLISFIFITNLKSQIAFKLEVKQNNGLIIPFATIAWGVDKGMVTDSLGVVSLNFLKKPDTLYVSALGFSTTFFITDKLKNDSVYTIFLNQLTSSLPEITVRSISNYKTIGVTDKKPAMAGFIRADCSNTLILVKVDATKDYFLLRKFSMYVKDFDNKNVPTLRLRIMSVGKNNLPEKDLLLDNILIKPYKKEAWNDFDLIENNINLNNTSFYIGVETICTDLNEKVILTLGNSDLYSEPATVIRNNFYSEFKLLSFQKLNGKGPNYLFNCTIGY